MDPISGAASVYQLVDAVAKVSKFVHRVQKDAKNAPVEIEEARKHVLVLEHEIEEVRNLSDSLNEASKNNPFGLSRESAVKAISAASTLMSDIRESFPVHESPETLRTRLKWAFKDKNAVAKLGAKLKDTESSLNTILQLEQTRITGLMWSVLLQQSTALARIEKQQSIQHQQFNALLVDQHNPQFKPRTVEVEINKLRSSKSDKAMKISDGGTRLSQSKFSAQLVLLPKTGTKDYGASLRLSLFSKMYSVDFRLCWFALRFSPVLRAQNIIPSNADIVRACKLGDFRQVQMLVAAGQFSPHDVTESHWPLLDYAIEGGNSRVVQLLLDNGSDPNITYDEGHMSPLQSAFMRGRLGIARHLLKAGADIDHVDRDGFSVLSYLWVTEKPISDSTDFLRLAVGNAFDRVNATDSRGWFPFHRAAAIGVAADIDAFVQMGASLDQRAEWYGWTPLFFAASHDNIETFSALLSYSKTDVNEVLDGDGWTLLHCAVYFGAKEVVKILLKNGINIHQKSTPAALPEDPELAYLELTARDIALYMGPERYGMYLDALSATGYDEIIDRWPEVFWDADGKSSTPDIEPNPANNASDPDGFLKGSVYGAEDVDEHWTILHWASYCGSPKVRRLLLMKGADPKHEVGINAYLPPSLDDIENARDGAEYVQGSVNRPFHPPSGSVTEIDEN